VTSEPSAATAAADTPDELLEEIDNPIERLKLLSGNEDEISKYLDAIEVTSPREREMLHEISRTRALADVEKFPQAHRNMVEALESLARHGYHGTTAGRGLGPLRAAAAFAVQLVARYLVVTHIRNTTRQMRNLYGLREIQALPSTDERRELRRARMDSDRMIAALETREIGLPVFVYGALAVPVLAAIGRATGLLESTLWGTVIGLAGTAIAIVVSWVILRGAALASRRIRLAARGPHEVLWKTIGWCGKPPKPQTKTFVIVSVGLLLAAFIIVPILIAVSVAT
jgi:hypothetical protein